jgi:hypothetical protein
VLALAGIANTSAARMMIQLIPDPETVARRFMAMTLSLSTGCAAETSLYEATRYVWKTKRRKASKLK